EPGNPARRPPPHAETEKRPSRSTPQACHLSPYQPGKRDQTSPAAAGDLSLIKRLTTLRHERIRRWPRYCPASLCCPVGGRPASARKSQSKSQRRQTSGDTQRRQATVKPGQVPTERH